MQLDRVSAPTVKILSLFILLLFLAIIIGRSRAVPSAFAAPHSGATAVSSASTIEVQLLAPEFSSDPTFSVSGTAHGRASIIEMKLYLDGVLSAHSAWGELSTKVQAEPGDHNLTLRATDSAGHAAEKSARVTVADPTPRGRILLAQLRLTD